MRFLLYPNTNRNIKSSSIFLSKQFKNNHQRIVAVEQQKQQPLGSKGNDNNYRSSDINNEYPSSMIKQLWGQQCNENCGCVVRFQCSIDMKTDRIVEMNYVAKTLLTTSIIEEAKETTNHNKLKQLQSLSSSSSSSKKQQKHKERAIVTTIKGRPMLKQCKCNTVHTLSNIIIQYIIQNQYRYDQLYTNVLNFNNTRSSISFRDTVLRTHSQLNNHTIHCYDMIEDALTAMIKGYIPLSRRQHQHLYAHNMKEKKRRKHQINHMIEWDHNNEYYNNNNETIQEYVNNYNGDVTNNNNNNKNMIEWDNNNEYNNETIQEYVDNYYGVINSNNKKKNDDNKKTNDDVDDKNRSNISITATTTTPTNNNDRSFFLRKNRQSEKSHSFDNERYHNKTTSISSTEESTTTTASQYPFGTIFHSTMNDHYNKNNNSSSSQQHHHNQSQYFNYNFYPIRNIRSSSYNHTTVSMYDTILAKQQEEDIMVHQNKHDQQQAHHYHYHTSIPNIRDWISYVDYQEEYS